MGRVVVVGSMNMDHVVRVPRLPAPGETIRTHDYTTGLGGKGFNQAVTAARCGADVVFVGCVGDDSDGDRLRQALADEGIDGGYVRHHASLPTGLAMITVDHAGENTITVVGGANDAVVCPSAALEGADVVLAQLECPVDVVGAALTTARSLGITTVLNPAPAQPLPSSLLSVVDYLVPNEVEAEQLGAFEFHGTAIVTLGAQGALLLRPGAHEQAFPAVHVDVVDTTAAGDAFCGCLVARLAAGARVEDSIADANAAGAHAVTIAGAYAALPTDDDVRALRVRDRARAPSTSGGSPDPDRHG